MQLNILKNIVDKAKTKKGDGVYSYNGYPYMLCNGDLFIGEFDTIYQFCYGFLSPVNRCESYKLKNTMKAKFKALKEQGK